MAAEAVLGWARRFAERGLPAEAATTTLPAVLWYTPAWNHSTHRDPPPPTKAPGSNLALSRLGSDSHVGGTTTQVLKRSITFTANVSEANVSAVNMFSVNVPTPSAAPALPAIADSPTPALPLLSIVPSEGSAAWTSGVVACFVGTPCFHISLFYGTIFSHTAMGMPPKKVAAPKYWALYIPGDGYGIFSCWGLCSSNGATGGRWAAHKKFKGIDAWDQAMAFVAMHVTDAPVQHIDVWYSFVNGPRSASSTLHGQAGQLNLVHGPPSERPAGGVPVLPSERWEPLRVPSPGQQHVCSMRAPHISPTSRGGEQALPDALAMGSKSGARPSSNDSPDASSPELPGGIRTGRPRSQPPCLCGFVHCDMAGQHCPLTASHASVVVWPRLDGWSGLEQRPRRTSGCHHATARLRTSSGCGAARRRGACTSGCRRAIDGT